MMTNVTAMQTAQSEPARHVQISAQMENVVMKHVKTTVQQSVSIVPIMNSYVKKYVFQYVAKYVLNFFIMDYSKVPLFLLL